MAKENLKAMAYVSVMAFWALSYLEVICQVTRHEE
jgi:hypothetical protein